MTVTINVPTGVGHAARSPYTWGPANVPARAHSFALSLQLSQATGANNSFYVSIQRSEDGGATWQEFVGGGVQGGATFPDTQGNDFVIESEFWGSTGYDTSLPAMQVQAVLTIVGANLTLSGGTLTVN